MSFPDRLLKRSFLAAAVVAATLGTAPLAQAQPVPPPGWAGPHYYWHGQHWHHRGWAYDRNHRRYRRYW